MITDAVFGLVAALMGLITSPLPVSTITIPAAGSIASTVAGWCGPLNQYVPMYEMAFGMVIVVTIFMPVALTYSVVSWAYKHIPFVGGG